MFGKSCKAVKHFTKAGRLFDITQRAQVLIKVHTSGRFLKGRSTFHKVCYPIRTYNITQVRWFPQVWSIYARQFDIVQRSQDLVKLDMSGKPCKAGGHFTKPGGPYKAHNAGQFCKPGQYSTKSAIL